MKKMIVLFFVLQLHAMENEIPQKPWKIKKTIKYTIPIKNITYNEPSKQLFALDEGKKVTLFNIEDTKKKLIQLSHFSSSWKPSFDPLGRYFIANTDPQKIALLNSDGKEIKTITAEDFPTVASFNNQGNQILIGGRNNVQLKNLDGTLMANCNFDSECWIKIAKFFPNNDNLIFLAPYVYHKIKYKAKLWDIRNKNVITYDYIDYLKKANIHPEGSYLNGIKQVEPNNITCIYDLRATSPGYAQFTTKSYSVKFNSSGTHILTKSYDPYLALLWNTKRVVQRINDEESINFALAFKPTNLHSTAFHPDGNQILTTQTPNNLNNENNLTIFDLDGNQIAKLPHQKIFYSAKYNSTGNYIISRHEDNIVTLWQKTE